MKCANKEDVTDSAKRAILTAAVREPRYLQLRLKPPAPEVILFGEGPSLISRSEFRQSCLTSG
jgi:hypothetical protein